MPSSKAQKKKKKNISFLFNPVVFWFKKGREKNLKLIV